MAGARGLAAWPVTMRGGPLLAMACTSISGRRGSPGKLESARMAASICARFRPGGGACTLAAGGGTDAIGGFCKAHYLRRALSSCLQTEHEGSYLLALATNGEHECPRKVNNRQMQGAQYL